MLNIIASDEHNIIIDELGKELRDHGTLSNRTKERSWSERKCNNEAMCVDALSMCFSFSTNLGYGSNVQRGEVLTFLCEHFFSTNLAS